MTDQISPTNTRRLQILTGLGFICLVISLAILFLWIHAFDQGSSQQERVQIYISYFPSFLGLIGVSIIEVLLALIAIVVGKICMRLRGFGWKLLNITILTGGSFIVLFNIWGLM